MDQLTLKLFHDNVNTSITGLSATETSAVIYIMSDAYRVNLQYKDDNSSPASVFIKRVVMADVSHVQLKMRSGP